MMSPPAPEEVFAQTLRRRRKELGISLRDLAERMQQQGHQWHHTTVARTESARRPVRLNEAVALAGILRMPLAELLTPAQDDHTPSNQDQLSFLEHELSLARGELAGAEYLVRLTREEMEVARQQVVEAQKRLHEVSERYRNALKARAEYSAEVDALMAGITTLKASTTPDPAHNAEQILKDTVREIEHSIRILTNSWRHPSRTSSPHALSGEPLTSERVNEALNYLERRKEAALEALRRVEAGTYGTCVDCRKQIEAKRLEACPEADRCTACQDKRDADDAEAFSDFRAESLSTWGHHLSMVKELHESGMSADEIAELLGETQKYVRAMLQQARMPIDDEESGAAIPAPETEGD